MSIFVTDGNVDASPQARLLSAATPYSTWLQPARDGALLLGGAAYLCGYLTRAVYANQYGLGLIAALDLQYFSAGIPPLATIVFSASVGWWAAGRFGYWSVRQRGWRRAAALGLLGAFGGLLPQLAADLIPDSALTLGLVTPAVATVLGSVGLTATGGGDRKSFWWYPFVSAVLVIPTYAVFTLPEIPQALGGGAPRCARLHIELPMSDRLRSELQRRRVVEPLPNQTDEQIDREMARERRDWERETKSGIFTSGPLLVWQIDDEWALVKVAVWGRSGDTLQLPARSIRGIEWVTNLATDPCQ